MGESRNALRKVISTHKQGESVGVYCVCSSHPTVLETSIKSALRFEGPLLIESTCNQVNQFGGYTGMLPSQFSAFVWQLAEEAGLPKDRIILGGDHLGPNPWRHESALLAMQKASQMVHDYVRAGYTKIHLDASMKCADDVDLILDEGVSADRTVDLCIVAEEASERLGQAGRNTYVIGTEVPAPGGVQLNENGIHVSTVEDVKETIGLMEDAFVRAGIRRVWERVIALVVQPGVDFGDQDIFAYDREKARHLSRFIEGDDQLVFEAHSTDYQTRGALSEMVEDHFAILKVGPELTYSYREAVFALIEIEEELLGHRGVEHLSNLKKVIDRLMVEKPDDWKKYYHGNDYELALARKYSLSDRIRYYWTDRRVQTAVSKLFSNLSIIDIPLTLVSQYFPEQFRKIREEQLPLDPVAWVEDKIATVLLKYSKACRY